MATYYKYAERNASSQINWYEVGKDITDMLKEENRVREEKKAKIDEDSRAYGQMLANAPTGQEKTINAWALDYASNAQEARLIQDRLLKSGQLKLKDYNVMRQNLTDGTKNAFSLVEDFQKEYTNRMERARKGESQALEGWYMAQAQEFLNFANSSLYINPTDYQVSVAKKNPDGSMSNEFATINDMRRNITQYFDYFNWDKETNTYVKSLGDFSTIIQQSGGLKNVKDQNFKDRLEASMRLTFESYAARNPYNFTSILTNDIGGVGGKAYNFTFDEKAAAADESLILLKKDPNNPNGPALPDFTTANGKKQKDSVIDFLKTQTLVKLESTETYQQRQQQYAPSYVYERGDKAKREQASAKAWNDIWTATSGESKNAAAQFIIGLPQNKEADNPIIAFDFETKKDYLIVQYADPKANRTIPIPKTLADWAKIGTEFTGITDSNIIFELSGGGDKNLGVQGDIKQATAKRAMADQTPQTTADAYSTIERLVSENFIEDEPKTVASTLNKNFSGSGLLFEGDTKGLTDDVVIVKRADGTVIGEYPVDEPEELAELASALNTILTDEYKTKLVGAKGAEPTGGATNSGGNAR